MWFCFPQEEEKRIASVMARKEEEKKKEISKLAVLKPSYLLTTGAQYIFLRLYLCLCCLFSGKASYCYQQCTATVGGIPHQGR